MPIDTGIKDTCYYFEDGSPWWTSADISVTGPDPTGKATSPAINTVRVNVRRKGAAGDPPCNDPLIGVGGQDPVSDFLRVDLYVCVPTSSPFGPTSSTVKRIRHFVSGSTFKEITLGAGGPPSFLGVPPSPGSSTPVVVNWKLPENPATPHVAEAPDHKCLVARVYTSPDDSPSSGSFQVIDDQHYAQRNICINFCSSPCGVEITMVNEDPAPRIFQLRVVQDLKPSPALRPIIDHALRQARIGDYRLAERTPRLGFGLSIKDMPNVQFVKDQPPDLSAGPTSEDGCLMLLRRLLGRSIAQNETPSMLSTIKRQQQQVLPVANLTPSYEGRIQLAPGQVTRYNFQTDLDGEAPGTVHVFHAMEIEAGVVQGGVTMLMVKG